MRKEVKYIEKYENSTQNGEFEIMAKTRFVDVKKTLYYN